MPRFRTLHPVNTLKHVVDIQSSLTAGTAESKSLVTAKDSPTLADPDSVLAGCTVSSVYLNVQVYATSEAALANVYLIVVKNPGGNLSNIAPNTVGVNDDKRFVIHQEMRMLGGSTTEIPVTLFQGVISVPRSYRRMGRNDTLIVRILAPGVNIDYCVQCIYKEIR